MKKKRGMPRNIIQGNRLQEPIVRRGRSRKEINELPENDKKCLTESEDESYSHSDFVVDQRPEENKKKIHSQQNEVDVLQEEGSYFESNFDLSSEDGKEATQENFQNIEHENDNEKLGKLRIETSTNSNTIVQKKGHS